VLLGLIAAFWLLVLSPKRAEVSDLDQQVSDARATVSSAQQAAAAGEQAKDAYASNYHQLVVLGKAVPAEEETSSLLVELQSLATSSGISFDSIELSSDAAAQASTEPPAAQTTADPGTGGTAATEGSTAGTAPGTDTLASALPTEATAATLPLGATVGPAGLPVMPYDLHFRGDFFGVADFIRGLDQLVASQRTSTGVDGRLLTIDGFSLGPDPEKGFPTLVANLHVTTYVAPADQGVTAGATSTAPPSTIPTTAGGGAATTTSVTAP
jgi:type IV pilus assembly PilO-like protein